VGRDSVEPCLISSRRQQQIRTELPPLDIAKPERIRQTFRAITRNSFPRIPSAQNFRRVKEGNALRETAEQKRCVHFTTAFDQQAGGIFRP
jgi:hypothetical protein